MFIATSKHTPKDLAPLGAKPGRRTFAEAGKSDCAPTELRSKEKNRQAINISPLWGEATNSLRSPLVALFLTIFGLTHSEDLVRELQNVIERAVILSDGETFSIDETWLTPVTPKTATTTVPLVANLVDHEKEIIENALRQAEGLISGPTGAATKLGIPRQTLESKIRKLGIHRHRFKTS